MDANTYTTERFVEDLRRLSSQERDERSFLTAAEPRVRQFAVSRVWLERHHYDVDPAQGFGIHMLHEEPDHRLTVFVANWLPGRGTPPHDHGTWAIVVGVDGPETNVFWARADDGSRPGYAELQQVGQRTFNPGEAVTMPSGTIHSVRNDSEQITLSLHVYGKHPNFTDRSQFDVAQHTRTPFIVNVALNH
jgi:predicted metal-dependent enzyme (double-stranded beta helix superfamily)